MRAPHGGEGDNHSMNELLSSAPFHSHLACSQIWNLARKQIAFEHFGDISQGPPPNQGVQFEDITDRN